MRTLRKMIASFSIVAILSTLVVSTTAFAGTYDDVSEDDYFYEAVEALVGSVLDPTRTSFEPGRAVNRAEAAKMVVENFNLAQATPSIATFPDVPTDHWSFPYVEGGVQHGVFSGNPDGNYYPGRTLNRAEVAKVIVEAGDFPLKDYEDMADAFSDLNGSEWYADYAVTAKYYGIINGINGEFAGANEVNRANMVVMLHQANNPTTDDDDDDDDDSDDDDSDDSDDDDDNDVPAGALQVEMVAMDSSEPLGSGTAFNEVLRVDLTASSAGPVTVEGITVKKQGLLADTNVSGVGVIDEDGVRHGNFVTVSDKYATIGFSVDPITIAAGDTETVTFQLNLVSGSYSGGISFDLEEGSIESDASSVTGLPVEGDNYEIQDGSGNVGSITLDAQTISTSARTVDVGVIDQDVAKFEITAGANEGMDVTWLTVLNNGSAADGDFTNIDLVDQDGNILATVDQSINKEVHFDLSDNPLSIDEGVTETVRVRVDVVDGSTRTVQFFIQEDFDIVATGDETGYSVLATPTNSGTETAGNETSFPIGDASGSTTYNSITINSGTLTVSKDTTSPSGKVGQGNQNVVTGSFKLDMTGERAEVRQACFDLDSGGSNTIAAGDLTGTVKLKTQSNGSSVYSVTPAASHVDDTCTQVTLSTYFIIDPDEDEIVDVVVNLDQSVAAATTMKAEFGKVYHKKLTSNTFATAASTEVAANTLTVDASTLTVAENTSYPDDTVVAGGNIKLGSINLQAGSAEGVSIQTIVVDLSAITGLTNLELQVDGERIGQVVASPATADNSFSVSGDIEIGAGDTVEVDVYADANSSATGNYTVSTNSGDISFTGIESGKASTSPSATVSFQTINVQSSGTLTASEPSQTTRSILHAGQTGVELMKFKLESQYENMDIDTVYVTTENGAGNFSNFTLKDSSGTTLRDGAAVVNGIVTFSGLTESLTKDSQKNYFVYADTTTSGTMLSDRRAFVALNGVEATGASSGADIQASADRVFTSTAGATSTKALSVGDIIFTSDAVNDYYMASVAVETGSTLTAAVTGVVAQGDSTGGGPSVTAGETITTGFPVEQVYTVPATGGSNNAWEVGTLLFVENDAADADSGFGMVSTAFAANSLNNSDTIAMAMPAVAAGNTTVATNEVINEVETYATTGALDVSAGPGIDLSIGDVTYIINAAATSNTGFQMVDTTVTPDTNISAAAAVYTGITLADSDVVTKLRTTCTEAVGTLASDTVDCDYNVGDVVWIEDADSTDGFHVVETRAEKGDTWASGTLTGAITLAATDRVTTVFSPSAEGNLHSLQDVELAIANNATESWTKTISGAEQTVAVWDFSAVGPRSLFVKQFDLTCTGSYSSNTGFNDNTFKIYVDDTLEITSTASDCTAGHTLSFSTPIEISANSSREFKIDYDTSVTSGAASGESLVMKIDGTTGDFDNGPVQWYYTAASPSPGSEPTQTSPFKQTDDYPVNAPTMTF